VVHAHSPPAPYTTSPVLHAFYSSFVATPEPRWRYAHRITHLVLAFRWLPLRVLPFFQRFRTHARLQHGIPIFIALSPSCRCGCAQRTPNCSSHAALELVDAGTPPLLLTCRPRRVTWRFRHAAGSIGSFPFAFDASLAEPVRALIFLAQRVVRLLPGSNRPPPLPLSWR